MVDFRILDSDLSAICFQIWCFNQSRHFLTNIDFFYFVTLFAHTKAHCIQLQMAKKSLPSVFHHFEYLNFIKDLSSVHFSHSVLQYKEARFHRLFDIFCFSKQVKSLPEQIDCLCNVQIRLKLQFAKY